MFPKPDGIQFRLSLALGIAEPRFLCFLCHGPHHRPTDEDELSSQARLQFAQSAEQIENEKWDSVLRRCDARDLSEQRKKFSHCHVAAGCKVTLSPNAAFRGQDHRFRQFPRIHDGKASGRFPKEFLVGEIKNNLPRRGRSGITIACASV